MADELEDIGGISVGIGANHAQLVAIVNESNRILATFEARWKNGITVNLGGGVVGGGGRAPVPAVRYGAAATTGVQSQQGQSALQTAINAQLAKTGERYNAVTGEITKATGAIKGQRNAIVAVQEAASAPTALNIDTAALQNDLNAVLGTLREIVSTAGSIGSLPAARIGVGAPASAAGGSASAHERAVNTDLATRIARTTTTVRRSTHDEDEPAKKVPAEYGANFPAIQLVDQLEKQRRSSREVKGPGPIEVNRSEQSLNRQRDREEKATAREQQRSAAATAKASANNFRNADRAALQALSAEAQASHGGARTSATFAPPLSETDQGRGSQARIVSGGSNYQFAPGRVPRSTASAAVRADQARDEQVFATTVVNREEQRQRAIEETVARRRASITAAGRTARTGASGISALFGGTQGALIEATANVSGADKAAAEAEKAALPFHRRMAEYDLDIANSSTKVAAARIKARDAFASDPKTVAVLDNERKAIAGQATALEALNKLQGPTSIARNLAAITAGGAAFSLGLKAVDFGLAVTEKAFSNVFDIATGFGAETTKVTGALAQQTAALHGNSAEAVANAEAQAGISTAAAQNLNPQLQLTTQVKAGAVAATSQQDLIRAALGAGNGAPQGLLGGYGGVLNGPFLAQQLGGGKGFAETIKDSFNDLTHPIAGFKGGIPLGPLSALGLGGGPVLLPNPAANGPQRAVLETGLNDAAKRGAAALGQTSDQIVRFGRITDAEATQIAQSNLPQELKDLAANSGEGLRDSFGNLITASDAATKALEQVAVGQGIAPADQIGRANLAAELERQRESAASLPAIRSQQAFQLPSQIAAAGRQLQYGTGTQLPVQQALAGLANPNVPVGTGIAPANAAEASRVAGSLKEAQGLQDTLNAKYAQGQQIIHDTYDPAILANFGQAAKTDFDQALSTVVSTGKEIASIQAGISNEQAAYQTAQYNFQLVIARRNLSDIGGLINANLGAGESYYGQLERQNLLLGRQAQLLQFALSQRQINFQVAQAGFQAPGVTAEERQANIAEAKIEASFAQKQLNISKAQFGNQVQLVDIGNLRQGRDLVRQIGLLQQGRQLTFDSAGAEQKILRLNQLQSQVVAKVGQYLSAVDNVTSIAFANITQLEAAAGRAMATVAEDVLAKFGITIKGLNDYLGGVGGGTASGTGTRAPSGGRTLAAGGAVGWLSGPTQIGTNGLAGEAGGEALLILSHPRSAGASGGGGGVTNIVQFNGPIGVRNDGDLRAIARAVEDLLNAKSARLGLRSLASGVA